MFSLLGVQSYKIKLAENDLRIKKTDSNCEPLEKGTADVNCTTAKLDALVK